MNTVQQLDTRFSFDWKEITKKLLISRQLDDLEEFTLVKNKKVLYQFSARGHDMAQIILGQCLIGHKDAVSGYYRSRPFVIGDGPTATIGT